MAAPSRLRRIVQISATAVLAVGGILCGRAALVEATPVTPATAPPIEVAVEAEAAAARLAGAIGFQTISARRDEPEIARAFLDQRAYLEVTFPVVHRILKQETFDHGLLYTWEGSSDAPALVLLAHLDVVPVEEESRQRWTHPPFEGARADGFVWGRGTLDDKGAALALLEAVEFLAHAGFHPTRTVVLAFGEDEELGGEQGAATLAAALQERQQTVAMVLDEGGVVIHDMIPGVDDPVALIGVAEKGYATVELTVTGEGGHSSMPPSETTVGILSAAVAALEADPFPSRLTRPTTDMFSALAPHVGFGARVALANQWLFGPLLARVLAQEPASAASVRTTTAPTIMEAGTKDNVLPSVAMATVNFRIAPGDTVQSVRDRVAEIIDDDRVKIAVKTDARDPSSLSPPHGEAWGTLTGMIARHFPEAIVAPYLVVGGTDARHYEALTKNVYRFLPGDFRPEDRTRVHGLNERVSVEAHARSIVFYGELIQAFAVDVE